MPERRNFADHFQHAADLCGGFVQITLTLCLTGERKPG
jgi:hypothetical protein